MRTRYNDKRQEKTTSNYIVYCLHLLRESFIITIDVDECGTPMHE